jgi:hypothetical protein
LYNELSNNFQGHLLIPNRTCGTNSIPDGVDATEDAILRVQDQDIDEDEFRGLNVRLPRPYGSDESMPDTRSVDDARSSEEEEDEEQEGEDEDEEVRIDNARDVVLSTPPPVGTALGETSETVALAKGGDTFASQISEMEREASDSFNFFLVQMRVRESLRPTRMERESEIQERDEGIGSNSQPILSSVQRCSASEDVTKFKESSH